MENLPMDAPKCPTGMHGKTEYREPRTEIDKWCGAWYDCPECGASVVDESPDLRELQQRLAMQSTN